MKSSRINISSNSPWEDIVGYSRAVKIDDHIYISGTTATDDNGNIVGKNNPYTQTKQIILKLKSALNKAGADLTDIVRLKIYVTNINDWEIISKAISEHFDKIRPAATMVEIQKLISPELLVEIEADAYISKID